MKMLRLTMILAAAIPLFAQSDVTLQRAIRKETVEGDLKGAIELYRKAAAEAGKDRTTGAQALMHLAQCYEKQGNAEARATYERVVREYADQKDAVATARARLGRNESALTTRRLWIARDSTTNMRLGGPSPDGKYLAYASFFTTGDLAVREIATGAARHVTNKGTWQQSDDYAYVSVVSPDGRRIAFGWTTKKGYQLRVIDFDGSNEKVIYSNPEIQWIGPVGFSTDGKDILAALHTRSRTGQLAWISIANGSARVLKTLPWASLGKVQLSPDGGWIAYDSAIDVSPDRTIYLLASDGSKEVALNNGSAKEEVFGWMPDGKWLLFATDRTGTRELWALPVDGGKANGVAVMVKPDIGGIEPLGITRTGSLLYSMYNTKAQLLLGTMDWENGRVQQATPAAQRGVVDFGPDFSPDGKHLAYIAHRGSSMGLSARFIVIRNLETGAEREVTPKQEFTISGNGGYRWSPDGRSFLVTGSLGKQGQGAYAIDITTGAVRPLVVRPGGTIQMPDWLPDGKSVIYRFRGAQNQRRIFVRDLEAGTDREIVTGLETLEYVSFTVSPDGRQLAFAHVSNRKNGGLYVMPLGGGTPSRLLVDGREPLVIQGWSPDSRRIVYEKSLSGPQDSPSTWWISPEGGEAHRIEVPWRGGLGQLRFHPDGRQLVRSHREVEAEVWVLENIVATLRASR